MRILTVVKHVPDSNATMKIRVDGSDIETDGLKMVIDPFDEFGVELAIQLRDGQEAAMTVAAKVNLFTRATSLGGIESLIEHRASVEGPDTTTPDNLLRLSIGLEHPDDLIADLAQAFGTL